MRGRSAAAIGPAVLARLPLRAIEAVVFHERDEITTDLICCDVEAQGRVLTFHEEMQGWQALIVHLAALPGFRDDWYEAVVGPPFDARRTVAFERR